MISYVSTLLKKQNFKDLQQVIDNLHLADQAELFEVLDKEDRQSLAHFMAPSFDAEILTYLESDTKDEILPYLEPKKLAKSVATLETDDALELIEDLDRATQEKIIKSLPIKSRQLVEEGLKFPEDSAGRLMQRGFVAVPTFWDVGNVIDYVRASKKDLPDDFYNIYIIDPLFKIVGYVPLSRLIRENRLIKLENIMIKDVRKIPFDMDQEEVAYLFNRYHLSSAPVIDENGRLLGVIMVDDIVEVISEEAEEDILNLANVGGIEFHAKTLSTAFLRIKWLLVLMFSTILASLVINYFKGTIDQIIVLAVLMPIVTTMGGNAGNQVVTVTIRALATKDLRPGNFSRVIFKELAIALINGLVFATIAGSIATLWFGNSMIGLILAASLALTLLWAGVGGTIIPMLLHRAKVDPAIAAGPILATTTDVFGFVIFLGLATLILL